MKTRALAMMVVLLTGILAAIGVPASAGSVHLTGSLSADSLQRLGPPQSINSFTGPSQPPFAGVGWEVIVGRVGLGGEYDVNFTRSAPGSWWVDWYAQPLFLSWHPFRTGSVVDPFAQAGLGSAGRVFIDQWTGSAADNMLISIFPFVAGGLSLDLDGFLVSGKVSYAPFMTPPPATAFSNYPMGNFQVTLGAGIAIDW